jgi:hypothetical protein
LKAAAVLAVLQLGGSAALAPPCAHRSALIRLPAHVRAAVHLASSDATADGNAPDLDEYLARLFGASEEELDDDAPAERIFTVDGEINHVGDDTDEFALMYKLRKELGDADFKAIFGTMRVAGPSLDGPGPSLPGR